MVTPSAADNVARLALLSWLVAAFASAIDAARMVAVTTMLAEATVVVIALASTPSSVARFASNDDESKEVTSPARVNVASTTGW